MESNVRVVEPRFVLGVDEFSACVEEAQRVGKWEAWKDGYFESFRGVFQPMLDIVYRFELDGLKPYVEALDFDASLRVARRFVAEGGVDRMRAAFDRCIEALPPVASFPVYLIVGIGHANGMALPAAEPYVFLGLECSGEAAAGLDGLIAHEYNHLVRVQAFYGDIDPLSLTVGDFAISEGLATVFALDLLGQDLSPETIAASISNLGDPASAVEREPEMRADLLAHWDSVPDREAIDRFIGSGTAYLVGGLMIARLLEEGHDILELTRTPPDELKALVLPPRPPPSAASHRTETVDRGAGSSDATA
jgi:hypothetical protein